MKKIIPPFSTTGIGSLPHRNSYDACELILRSVDIPFWPQLPNLSFREYMITQFSEGMPFVKMNEQDNSLWVIRDGSDELDRFYESYNEKTKIAISEDYAAGLHAFMKLIKWKKFGFLKGQVTGPVTFTLSLKDPYGRLIYFDDELREVASLILQAKARWQIEIFKQFCDEVIIFIDEPILSAIGGSSYLSVNPEEILRLLKDIVSAIEKAGGIAGIHCCGKADLDLIIKSGIMVLSFDVFDYSELINIYKTEIINFLEKGNYLAWGIVPTSDVIQHLDEKNVISLMNNTLTTTFKIIPRELLLPKILLTPSCGTASRTIGESTKIFQILMRLKEAFQG